MARTRAEEHDYGRVVAGRKGGDHMTAAQKLIRLIEARKQGEKDPYINYSQQKIAKSLRERARQQCHKK